MSKNTALYHSDGPFQKLEEPFFSVQDCIGSVLGLGGIKSTYIDFKKQILKETPVSHSYNLMTVEHASEPVVCQI